MWYWSFFFSSRRRHTRCALVTGVQTCALPIYEADAILPRFAQPDDTARADVDPGAADFVERIEAVLKCPRRDDILVILRARVDIMVVIIEHGDRERLRCSLVSIPSVMQVSMPIWRTPSIISTIAGMSRSLGLRQGAT